MSLNSYHNLPDLARKGGFTLDSNRDEQEGSIDWRFIGKLIFKIFKVKSNNFLWL